MAITEAAYLKMMWGRNECPHCHRVILEGERVGTGRKADGGFCSLDCYARYNALEFAEKAMIFARQDKAVQ
jgi:hypothetical protein